MVANPVCLLLIRIDHLRKPLETREDAWIWQMKIKAGINTNVHKLRSVRLAAASKAKAANVSLVETVQTAGWSSAATFAKFYDREIEQGSSFTDSILSLS